MSSGATSRQVPPGWSGERDPVQRVFFDVANGQRQTGLMGAARNLAVVAMQNVSGTSHLRRCKRGPEEHALRGVLPRVRHESLIEIVPFACQSRRCGARDHLALSTARMVVERLRNVGHERGRAAACGG